MWVWRKPLRPHPGAPTATRTIASPFSNAGDSSSSETRVSTPSGIHIQASDSSRGTNRYPPRPLSARAALDGADHPSDRGKMMPAKTVAQCRLGRVNVHLVAAEQFPDASGTHRGLDEEPTVPLLLGRGADGSRRPLVRRLDAISRQRCGPTRRACDACPSGAGAAGRKGPGVAARTAVRVDRPA
jgi:hypothetical protein